MFSMLLPVLILRTSRLQSSRGRLYTDGTVRFAEEFDGDRIKAPLLLLPSSGEDMAVVSYILRTFQAASNAALIWDQINKIYEAVKAKNPGKNQLKHYPSSPHGWCAARGDVCFPLHDEQIHKADDQSSIRRKERASTKRHTPTWSNSSSSTSRSKILLKVQKKRDLAVPRCGGQHASIVVYRYA